MDQRSQGKWLEILRIISARTISTKVSIVKKVFAKNNHQIGVKVVSSGGRMLCRPNQKSS